MLEKASDKFAGQRELMMKTVRNDPVRPDMRGMEPENLRPFA